MKEKEYWELRDKVVNGMGTKQVINLVIDLLGNLKDLEDEVISDYPFLKKDYKRLNEFIKGISK